MNCEPHGLPTTVGTKCNLCVKSEAIVRKYFNEMAYAAPESTEALIARLTRERDDARRQVTEFQAAGTRGVLERRNLLRATVQAWNEQMGIETPREPTVPDDATVRLRARLIIEEMEETLVALGGDDCKIRIGMAELALAFGGALGPVDMVEALDGAVDLLWVVEGTAQALGCDTGPILAEVSRSNSTKRGDVKHGAKIAKGPDVPPDVEGCLRAQGWKG